MNLRDVPGWLDDGDCGMGPPLDWPVCIVRVKPTDPLGYVDALVSRYERAYRLRGPLALAPIVSARHYEAQGYTALGLDWVQVTGAHRLAAANLAGLPWILSWLAYLPGTPVPDAAWTMEVLA